MPVDAVPWWVWVLLPLGRWLVTAAVGAVVGAVARRRATRGRRPVAGRWRAGGRWVVRVTVERDR